MLQIHVNRLETIIMKLATNQELDEKDQGVVDRILAKRGVAKPNEEN